MKSDKITINTLKRNGRHAQIELVSTAPLKAPLQALGRLAPARADLDKLRTCCMRGPRTDGRRVATAQPCVGKVLITWKALFTCKGVCRYVATAQLCARGSSKKLLKI